MNKKHTYQIKDENGTWNSFQGINEQDAINEFHKYFDNPEKKVIEIELFH